MDRTPPSHQSEPRLPPKSATRLARNIESDSKIGEISTISLDLVPSPSFSSPKYQKSLPVRDLLLLSSSPLRKSRTRLAERLELLEYNITETNGSKKPRKSSRAGGQNGLLGCASPRNNRRSRKRVDQEIGVDKEVGFVEDAVKVKKRRQAGRPKKEKPSLTAPSSTNINESQGTSLDHIGLLISDLIMWKEVAKSSLWFGFGSLCFISSCFSRGIGFSLFSAMSQLGLLFLGLSFLKDSICPRINVENTRKFELKEEDILRAARVVLPAANLVISKTVVFFSGEPSMTLKVVPFLLLGAEYGYLITLKRLCALGFFIGFTAPKLYSCYDVQINKKVNYLRRRVAEIWGSCSHKKIVATSAVTVFWNLSTMKTRILSAFIFLVILRYHRQQQSNVQTEEGKAEEMELNEQQLDQQTIVAVEGGLQK